MILDGKKVRNERKEALMSYIEQLKTQPRLVIVQVGDNQASNAYIAQKKIFGESIGVSVLHIRLGEDVSFDELEEVIMRENTNKDVHGIIVQLPLPEHLDRQQVIDCIDPQKDVDGLTADNASLLATGKPRFVPATARGIRTLLESYGVQIAEKKVVVIGRSALVGRPTAQIMETAGADVTVCHRGTDNIPAKTREADIIIVAAGHPRLVTEEYVRDGQVVVDVGINIISGECVEDKRPDQKYVGDVDFEPVSKIVSDISPVPGGVGPMTVFSLFENLVDAYNIQKQNV